MGGQPLEVLETSLESEVTVRLKNGDEYIGVLSGYDQHMNLVLRNLTAADESTTVVESSTEDTTIIRGDNVVSITT